ncbi:L-threonylcarbamoyladenylate synthase [Bifidobacterium tissieri]|uniref:L-threonylcarbamoyladenylate synthase n=1 Tax=Bifidobacterium tissieri TaxID=1630162 RepID=A0A5M9ZYN8_9BIFI|nr:L-threonylcarbamoyladenylate synthase [Bifidobacterium tissieri]KAA8830470.1 threonylcarbamoyl-AMP synthase [Bifidobacterium tissieri]KAA8832706.1 threonylcarbamoyl-AMP synthase [Bifidobacterium tissieri]
MVRIMPICEESLALAAELVQAGKLIVVPTDTVYGVACDPRNPDAVDRIFKAKRRPRAKSLQVLLASVNDIDALGLDLPVPLDRLSNEFLPGAFSPICVARDDCALATVRVDPQSHPSRTQGIRVPDSADTLRILRATGPLAASSANLSGHDSAQTAQQAAADLGDAIALYLDGGPTPGPLSSTVVASDPHGRDGITILRDGVIPQSRIREALHGSLRLHSESQRLRNAASPLADSDANDDGGITA